jgi:hypothetical protein
MLASLIQKDTLGQGTLYGATLGEATDGGACEVRS